MEANKSLELARKAYPNDENLRVAYLLGLQKGAENLEEKLSKAVKLADAMYYAAQMMSTDASYLKEAMKNWWNFKNVGLKESEDELAWLKKYIKEEAYFLSMDIRDNEDRIKLKKLQRSLAWLEKQGEQKPWSEEEKGNIDIIVSRLEVDIEYWESRSKRRVDEDKRVINWLKSLKQRIAP